MSAPPMSPPLDPYGKPMYHSVNSQLNTLPRGQLPPANPEYPIISLWKEEILAILAGSAILILGILGLLAGVGRGPLFNLNIPPEALRGPIVNPSNIGSLIGALIVMISLAARIVLSGVSRAWLRRQTLSGSGPTVRQWRTVAAGISARDARRTPFLAGGLFLSFTIAIALLNPVLLGVAIPNVRDFVTSYQYTNIVPFAGNNGTGLIARCGIVERPCAQFEHISKILDAFGDGLRGNYSSTNYQTTYGFIKSSASAGFLGGVVPPNVPQKVFRLAQWETPISKFTTTCTRISDAGAESSGYYYGSTCLNRRVYYGNSSQASGTYTSGGACINPSNTGVILELAIGGFLITDVSPVGQQGAKAYGVRCDVSAVEAFGIGRFEPANATTTFETQSTGFGSMRAIDLAYISDAFLQSLRADYNTDGHATAAQLAMAGPGTTSITTFERAISNAHAASATFGYTRLVGGGGRFDNGTAIAQYRNVISSLPLDVYVEGYGWTKTPRMLGWSSVCIVLGLLWLLAAIYMLGGGTRYDPTDWFQTLNTAVGSNLVQRQGTCTGAHLRARTVNKEQLWYGELYPGHVGFSQVQAAPIQPREKYGDAI